LARRENFVGECDMTESKRFNRSTYKTVPNLLKAIYLRLRKIVRYDMIR